MDSLSITVATGSYQFSIDHSKTKDMGIGKCVYSPKFRVGEYDWAVQYYPQGQDKDDGKYISVFVWLQRCSVTVDVAAAIEVVLLDRNANVSAATLVKCLHTFKSGEKCAGWGWSTFFQRTDLEEKYVKDGFFVLRVSITLKDEACSGGAGSNAGPADFPCKRIKKFREDNIHTDVTFDVDGSLFVAHKLILAAHSPVFEAELFGAMAESNTDCIIKINEMVPSVFKAMLDFMYSGSLPLPVAEELNNDDKEAMSLITLFQDLLVAADRYAVEKLKSMCEHKLVGSISLNNVLSLLELADKHSCSDMKKKCLKFIATKDNLVSLVLTEGYVTLMHNYPFLLAELKEMASK